MRAGTSVPKTVLLTLTHCWMYGEGLARRPYGKRLYTEHFIQYEDLSDLIVLVLDRRGTHVFIH